MRAAARVAKLAPRLRRVDMGGSGLVMCRACAADALGSGVFG